MFQEEESRSANDYLAKENKVLDDTYKRKELLQDKIDKILLDIEIKNEDLMDLSSALPSHVNVTYDMKSLIKSEFIYDVDPDIENEGLSAQEFMDLHRRRSEAKLIKLKLIYKLYTTDHQLTGNEKKYLQAWIKSIKEDKDRNLLNLRDTMLPATSTKLTVNDIDAKTMYSFNSVSKVSLDRDLHGAFSLSDLVLELSHFLDEEVVNKVETEIFSERLRKEWGLSSDFKAVESRNKEISLVLNELEELAWRSSGTLNEEDLSYIKRMLSVKRNKDKFDKYFYENDIKSLEHFTEAINPYDNRIQYLENWIARKEEEIKHRVNRPPEHMKRPDHEIFAELEKPQQRARESLVAKLLAADE